MLKKKNMLIVLIIIAVELGIIILQNRSNNYRPPQITVEDGPEEPKREWKKSIPFKSEQL